MENRPQKSKHIQENPVSKRHFIPVKSRYLNITKKGSSQSGSLACKSVLETTNQSTSSELKLRANLGANCTHIGNGHKSSATSTSTLQDPKSGKVLKTSTPTKDAATLFAADVSVVPIGTECDIQKKLTQEDLARLEEEILLQDNTTLCLTTLHFLMKRQQSTSAQDIDMQLAALQKAVDDSGSILSTLDIKLYAANSLAELREDLTMCEDAIGELSDDLAFSDSKCFNNLTSQIENVLNQLPCKNVKIPSSQEDLDEIRRAATRLSKEVSTVLRDHEKGIGHVSRVRRDMSQVEALCDTLAKANASMKELMPMASAKVMDEISRAMMNSAFANMNIKF